MFVDEPLDLLQLPYVGGLQEREQVHHVGLLPGHGGGRGDSRGGCGARLSGQQAPLPGTTAEGQGCEVQDEGREGERGRGRISSVAVTAPSGPAAPGSRGRLPKQSPGTTERGEEEDGCGSCLCPQFQLIPFLNP